jgi:myo-inositol 2-dehydrogenase / D-chiro-inositol 1-dehydrogenase
MNPPASRRAARGTTRRDVLRGGTTAILASAIAPYARTAPLRAGGDEVLRVGLIGCGGRGRGAAWNALMADPNTKLVALGDIFADHLADAHKWLSQDEQVGARVEVDEAQRFVGWDAYKGVIENSDVVLMAGTPAFRPLHVEAGVEAGKHMFVEKPVATDGPSLRRIMAAGELAREKGLSLVSGLCYRYQFAKQETIQRIHDGAIGDIVSMQTTYNAGPLWLRTRQPEWTEVEYQIRNWIYYYHLSGDHIAEQHIHSLDKIAWAKDGYPIKATSSGGRIQRTGAEYGNVYDHFNTVYEWEDGVRAFSSCRQWNNAAQDVSDYVHGTHGSANLQGHRIRSGKAWNWRYESEEPDDMYQNEHDALFASIRDGDPINNSDYMCKSTLMALMGRLSAYTGRTITAEEALQSQEDLAVKERVFGDVATAPVAIPGVHQFS